MYCPYCEQGKIVKAIVKSSGELIFICEECDTVWASHEKISSHTGLFFLFMLTCITWSRFGLN